MGGGSWVASPPTEVPSHSKRLKRQVRRSLFRKHRSASLAILTRTLGVFFATCALTWCAVTGGISGVVSDATGAVIAGAMVTATNTAQGLQTKTTTDAQGFYNFPRLPVGS